MLSYGTITSAMFNAASRYIKMRASIYFTETPVSVTSEDYITSLDITEECLSESITFEGTVIANMLTLKLSAIDKRFSPHNTAGPYYGLIKGGVKIVVEAQPVATGVTHWVALGTFYVSEWVTDDLGFNSSITCFDLTSSLSTKVLDAMGVETAVTQSAYLDSIMTAIGISSYTVSITKNINLVYAFPTDSDWTRTLDKILSASVAFFNISRTEVAVMKSLSNADAVVATITDADQIQTITTRQTIKKPYIGCSLTYVNPVAMPAETLVKINEVEIAGNDSVTKIYEYSNRPARYLDSVCVFSSEGTTAPVVLAAGNKNINLKLENTGATADTIKEVRVIGEYIDLPEVSSAEATDKIAIKSEYLHTEADVAWYTDKVDAFILEPNKFITVKARGNLLFELGDKIQINSTRYAISFTGILIKATYMYGGALSAEYVFLNVTTLGAV